MAKGKGLGLALAVAGAVVGAAALAGGQDLRQDRMGQNRPAVAILLRPL